MKKIFLLLFVSVIFSFSVFAERNYIEIGTGTIEGVAPVYSSWNYSWSSFIYPASQLSGISGKQITKIAFAMTKNANYTWNNQRVYIKLSSNATFSSNAYENPTQNGYTKVYEGNVTFLSNPAWTEITLTTPFTYDGTSNLIIHWENRHGTSGYLSFRSTDASSTPGVIKVGGSDSGFPTSSGYMPPYPNAKPNIRFYFEGGPDTPSNPSPANGAQFVSVNTVLKWNLGENTTHYDLYFGTNQNSLTKVVDNAPVTSAGTYTYTPPAALQSFTQYYWKVVAKNATTTTEGSVWGFKTEKIITTFPYSEGFEGYTWEQPFPDGWNSSDPLNGFFVVNDELTPPHFGHSGYRYVKVTTYHQNPVTLTTPKFLIPNNGKISFWWIDNTELPVKENNNKYLNADTTYFEISNNDGQTWTVLKALTSTQVMTAYIKEDIFLNNYAGQYVLFRWRDVILNQAIAKGFMLDDISLESGANPSTVTYTLSSNTFTEIATGTQASIDLTISVAGQPVVVTGNSLDAPFSCPFTGTINPGTPVNTKIYFNPTSAGTFNDNVSFNFQSGVTENNNPTITGVAYSPLTTIAPAEGFEGSTSLPNRWNKIIYKNPTDIYTDITIRTNSSDAHTGNNSLRFYISNDSTATLFLVSPGLTNFSKSRANKLTFWAKTGWTYTDIKPFEIGLMTNVADTTTYTSYQTFNLTNTYQKFEIIFTNINTSVAYVVFKFAPGKNLKSVYIDDISWEAGGTVPNPAVVVFPTNNQTNVDIINNNPLILNWVSGGGEPTGYKIYIGTDVNATNIVNGQVLGDTLKYAFSGATYGTKYYWKIVPYNSFGDATNCPIWSFTAMNNPTVTVGATPYSENFNSYASMTIPLGWCVKNLSQNVGGSWRIITNTTSSPNNAHSAPAAMHLNFGFYPRNDWAFTPPLVLTQGHQYQLKFWMRRIVIPGGLVDYEKIEVKCGTETTPTGMTIQLYKNENYQNDTYQLYTVNFNVPTSGTYYIGWHCYSDAFGNLMAFDDVQVIDLTGIEDNQANITFSAENVPNPFNPITTIRYNLPKDDKVTIEIYNSLGQKITTLLDREEKAGINKSVVWNGKDNNGNSVASGIYFFKVKTSDKEIMKKMLLVK